MKQETKQCQNCKQEFRIESEDFAFYEKIDVPPPTFCPECRSQRKYTFRNERALYKRVCDLTGQEMISQYSPDVPFPVYETTAFYSQKWDVPSLDYNPEVPFFEQLKQLSDVMPRPTLLTDVVSIKNDSVYQNASSRNKNCYLVFASGDNKDCIYGNSVDYCKTCVDGLWTRDSEFLYECIDCYNSSNLFFCQEARYCSSAYFLFNCRNCSDCFGCVGLRNKQYCFLNEQLSKEEYKRRIGTVVRSLTPEVIRNYESKVHELSLQKPRKYAHVDITENCTGDFLANSRNVKNSFMVFDSEDCKYSVKLVKGKSCYDINDWGDPAELCYECITVGKNAYRCLFSNNCWPGCHDVQYCDTCSSSEHLFGCIGLDDASYRVLNKLYSKADWEKLVPEVMRDMRERGEYGQFFPVELSPFAYNETIAQEYYPLSAEGAVEAGYRWKNPEERDYDVTLEPRDLPDRIENVGDDILEQVIRCEHNGACKEQCTQAFRIVPQELQFYRQFQLPLPRLCPNCRHYQRLKRRNPMKLWHRTCQCAGVHSDGSTYRNVSNHSHHNENHCPNKFETPYSPERQEIVYCEQCYQQEMV